MNILKKWKLQRKIPRGPYCYSSHLGKQLCPYYMHKFDSDVEVVWCDYLKCGDISSVTEAGFEKLVKSRNGNTRDLCLDYPLDTLWDQVKECGVKE